MAMRSSRASPFVLLVLVCIAGCDRDRIDVIAIALDASQAATDGGETRCDWSLGAPAFGGIEHLAVLSSTADDGDPTLSPDQRTLFVSSLRNGNEDIFASSRPSLADAFPAPMPYVAANDALEDTRFMISTNGLEAFLSSYRAGGPGGGDIFRATRSSTAQPFSSFAEVSILNSASEDFDPFITADGLSLYYAPNGRADAIGGQDVYVSTRASLTDAFGTPTRVPAINTTSADDDPSLTSDERVIVFASSQSGMHRIYFATRGSKLEDFGPSIEIPSLAGEPPAFDPFVTADGCAVYFTSARPDSLGLKDLYRIEVAR